MADQYDEVVSALNPTQPTPEQDPADAVVQAMAVQQVQGPISRTLLATQAGVIGGFLQDATTMEAVEMQPDLRVVVDEVVMEKEAQYEQALRAALDGYLTTIYGPQQLEAAITGAQQIQEEKAKREQSPIKNEIHFAEMTAVEAERRQQELMAQQQAWINEAAALTDDRGWWDTALDIAGLLVPFGEAKDIADIDNLVRDNPALADIAGDDLERIAANFQSLPLERQREIWPHLKQAVIDATASSGLFMIDSESNLLKAQSYLLTLLGTGGVGELRAQQIADVALGAMDVPVNPIAAGTAIARLSGQASATTKVLAQGIMKKAAGDSVAQASPAHAAARAGDINSAARHTVSTLADPDIAAKMGTDSVDAALNAMPHPTKDWWNVSIADDALPGAVRTELNDAIQKAAGNARSLTDEYEFLRVGAITQASRKKFVESFTDTMMGKVKADYLAEKLEMDNLRILNEGPDGFTYQYTLRSTDPQIGSARRESAHTRRAPVAPERAADELPTVTDKSGQTFVDTRGTGQRFHGTSDEIQELAEYTYSSANIYGQGFYTTDAADIALGYTKKGQGGSPTLYRVEAKDVKLYDLEQPMTPELKAQVRRAAGGNWRDSYDDDTALTLGRVLDDLRDDGFASANEIQSIMAAVQDAVRRVVGKDVKGYTHTGGLLTGNEARPHSVNIYWNPAEDVKLVKADVADVIPAPREKTALSPRQQKERKPLPPSAGKPRYTVKTGTIKMGIDKETGTFTATTTDTVAQRGSGILSPAAYAVRTAEGDFNLAVKQQLQSSQVEAAVAQRVANMAIEAFKPISGLRNLNARKRVDSVIAAGDEWIDPETGLTGKVFTPTELIAGVPDANGNLVKLTNPNEMEAYYKYRMFADAMHKVEDFTLKRELNLGGFKDVDLAPSLAAGTDADAWKKFQVFAKPFENKGAALASVREKIGQGMYDSKTGKTIEITEDMVREIYDQGDVLVRIRDKWNSRGNGDLDTKGVFVEYARVGREQLAEIGARRPVLPYKQGYAPKVNKGEYAVRMMVPTAGKNVTFPDRPQVVRLFNSLKDAKMFRNQLIEAERAKLGDRITAEQEAALQRMYPDPQSTGGMGMAERIEETAGRHGGLFQGTRSADEVLFGLEGKKAERVSPIDTLYRHTQHVGAFVAKNEQRISLEKRWLNTVREMFPEVRVMGFDRTVVPNNTPAGKMLNRMQNQIREWNAIPTYEETLFQAWIQKLHDWVLTGKRGLGLSSDSVTSLQYLKHTNPLTALKAANMHMLLGVMNPRQIIVQAAAAVVAATKHPGVAGKAFVDSFMFSMLDNIRNDTALGKAAKMLVRNGQIEQDVADAYLAWRRTGLYESMFNNADTAKMATDGLGVGASALRSASNLSMSVYRVGEGFNRRFSFLVEYNNWRRTTGKSTPNDDELFQILEETNKNMLELDQANRAWWQGGSGTGIIRQVIGVATQFLQVPAKTMELVLKSERRGGFTPAHKRRIVLGQLALFGAAGLPFGTTLVQTIAAGKEAVTGEPLVVDPELAEAINQGATGFVINTLLGAELDVASSVAPAAGAVDLVRDVILSDDPMYVRMLGASASTGSRVLDLVSTLSALAYVNRAGDVDMGVDELRMALKSIAQIPSTSRNLLKRWIMANQNQILDRRGRPVVKGDFDSLTEFGAMLGFPTTYENEAFILSMTNQEWEEMAKERADWQVRMMHQAIYEMQMDPNKIRAYMRALQVVDETLPVWVWKKSYEQFEERIFGDKPESKLDEEVAKYLKRVAPDLIREGAVVDNKLGFKYSEQAITQPFRSRPIEE